MCFLSIVVGGRKAERGRVGEGRDARYNAGTAAGIARECSPTATGRLVVNDINTNQIKSKPFFLIKFVGDGK